ncbi:molecular chaperone [Stenotrophomonas sp. CFBP 13718]|uniref:fimbrial biogenesis chaperone n=1 Tax=Stenotrophomonas sp. CFBP 13718 TaxID=2775304 RepID=UPI001783B34E|nr:molecular chaperone [Stenotrophomonas sp. CFBP 13718]MBD8695685.1 molecular chaperone [Stenotrophomonas sp. CFBP 13718]
MNFQSLRCSVLLLSALASQPAAAAVTLQGTRIVHDAASTRDVTLRARNTGEQAALTQVWIDDGDSHARPENIRTPFRLTPADPRLLQPHQGQAYRITYAPRPSDAALPADRESVFYFNLLDIPPRPETSDTANLLQFAIRTRIKLFHRPAGLAGKAADAAAALKWTASEGPSPQLTINNPSAYHVTLASVTLADGRKLAADMVPPFGKLRIPLDRALPVPAPVSIAWLDDYGAQRQHTTSINASDAAADTRTARKGR